MTDDLVRIRLWVIASASGRAGPRGKARHRQSKPEETDVLADEAAAKLLEHRLHRDECRQCAFA
jgi:hypothetical protein